MDWIVGSTHIDAEGDPPAICNSLISGLEMGQADAGTKLEADSQLTDLKFKVEQLEGENEGCIDNGKRLLELAQKAASLYSAQIPAEKRKLLNLVHSNSTWAGGELATNYRKPFDMIAGSNSECQRKKATSLAKSDLLDIWRPLPDLNRCRRRERAVSWARLDEGDV